MPTAFNIYCDESCHLEHDKHRFMVMGALWCPVDKSAEIARKIRAIKVAVGLRPQFELKWVRTDNFTLPVYKQLVDYFFAEPDLHFRVLIADKQGLDHAKFAQTHDDWYYKMYFTLLSPIFDPANSYRIYLDIKDTRSACKMRKLEEVLRNSRYAIGRSIIARVQTVQSHEIEQLQIADLFIGAVQYGNNSERKNNAKFHLMRHIQGLSAHDWTKNTLVKAPKFNMFHWQGQNCNDMF